MSPGKTKKRKKKKEKKRGGATGDSLNFGVKKYQKLRKKNKNKAIDHANCDPLTVSEGSLHTAFNIKHGFRKK